ncbi:MAG: ABC transporter permease [Gammaproteobacteria bacterium]|nr:ABC transporter permease [Gammaproteobacteria bacterium]
MIRRIAAVLNARNVEFLRDRSTLGWNIFLPVLLVLGLSFIFSGQGRPMFKVAVLQQTGQIDVQQHPFLQTKYVEFFTLADQTDAVRKVARHKIDMLLQFQPEARYWVNPEAPKGYILERLLLQTDPGIARAEVSGEAVRYVDWLLPGILGMNMMFSCLFGVGYVVVRYRKNGFLKRLNATPLRPIEFIIAQVLSRLILIMAVTVFVYIGTRYFIDFRMQGSYVTLFIVALTGAICLISLGLVVAARFTSEELAGGILNMLTWPMMLVSGVWFSLEGSHPAVQMLAKIFPLTHILDAARAVMLDGATLVQIMPQLSVLGLMSVVFLFTGAAAFRWQSD